MILREVPSHVELTVQDNGCGITQEKLNHSRSFGLLGMQERAWAIGGELEITSSPRSGTTVKLTVPIATPGEASVAPESSARVNGSAASHLASWINRPQSAEAPAAPERR